MYGNADILITVLGVGQHDPISLIMQQYFHENMWEITHEYNPNAGMIPTTTNLAATVKKEQKREYHKKQHMVYQDNVNMGTMVKTLLIKNTNTYYLKNSTTGTWFISESTPMIS